MNTHIDTHTQSTRSQGAAPCLRMIAGWLDNGYWEAWDDGRSPIILIMNMYLNSTLALTPDGFLCVGADAGPLQMALIARRQDSYSDGLQDEDASPTSA